MAASFSSLLRIGAQAHHSSVERHCLVSKPRNQSRKVTVSLTLVHYLGVSLSFTNTTLESLLYVLPHLGTTRHLAEIVGVKANKAVFDH